MSVRLYAIGRSRPAWTDGVRGIDDGPLWSVDVDGDLAAAVGRSGPDAATRADDLRRYASAVEMLMGDGTVLPVRFGTTVVDEAAVARLLHERRDEFLESLGRLAGAVEIGVRAEWPSPPQEGAAPAAEDRGADYLKGRLEMRRRARAIAARVEAAVRGVARESRCRILARPQMPVAAAYLVDRGCIDEFVDRTSALGGSIDGAEIVCTGPWPPYSFVGGDDT